MNERVRTKRILPDFILNSQREPKRSRDSKFNKATNSSEVWQPPLGVMASQSPQIGNHVSVGLSAEEEALVLAAISSADSKVIFFTAAIVRILT
jgi:hypothetical protein